MNLRRATDRPVILVVVGIVLLGSILYLLALAYGGAELVSVSVRSGHTSIAIHDVRAWLVAAAAAAVLVLLNLGRAEVRLARGVPGGKVRQPAADATADGDRETERLRRQLREERAQREHLVAAWRSQREWNTELRSQIVRMQRAHGALGRHDDVREMVLELTMNLVDAEKGLLLSGADGEGGAPGVVCALGFDHDPSDSAMARRFAAEVIEHGHTVREDDVTESGEGRTAADREVRNLLAIPVYLLDEPAGAIVCANRADGFEGLDDEVLVSVGDHAGAVLGDSRQRGDLRAAYLGTLGALADAMALREPERAESAGRAGPVSEYVLRVADQLDFDPRQREELVFAALLRDTGKLAIPDAILLKPGPLGPEERLLVERHPQASCAVIERIPALRGIAGAVRHHHERFDGTGYPDRLAGQAIPLGARIIAVADAFTAMTSERPYQPARSVDEACAELERCAGDQFDPRVVELFVAAVRT